MVATAIAEALPSVPDLLEKARHQEGERLLVAMRDVGQAMLSWEAHLLSRSRRLRELSAVAGDPQELEFTSMIDGLVQILAGGRSFIERVLSKPPAALSTVVNLGELLQRFDQMAGAFNALDPVGDGLSAKLAELEKIAAQFLDAVPVDGLSDEKAAALHRVRRHFAFDDAILERL